MMDMQLLELFKLSSQVLYIDTKVIYRTIHITQLYSKELYVIFVRVLNPIILL